MPFVSNIYKFVPPILEVISYLLENTWPPENISEFDMSSQCKDEPMEDESPITLGQPLSDFLLQLEDYTPTKFISDVANDALQHCKMRTSNSNTTHASNSKTAKGVKDKKYCLTMEDLTPALAEFGIVIKKPHYYV
ncbi:hypothetical protein HUJ04_005927 [Dendroctonus ponderosae]|nr:hypothetical protein HUJ04_005927 [Dendroctonus ponderosae]